MSDGPNHLVLCACMPLAAGDVPEWVHLLPAGTVRTVDGRGPYSVVSMQALAAASLQGGAKLPLDENHATDKGAPIGLPSRACGWIVALEARADGLWGRVDWTGEGRRLVEDRAYAGISPVILHDAKGRVLRILRASLTNTPNLQGLVALHSEENAMDWKARLIELLGLDSGADDAAIEAALTARMEAMQTGEGKATMAQALLGHPKVIALQAELGAATAQIKTLMDEQARIAAAAFVDAAIREGAIGLKPLREDYIALHMQDAARAEKLIAGMPKIGPGTGTDKIFAEQGSGGLVAEDRQIMALFGVSEEEYLAGLKKAGQLQEAL